MSELSVDVTELRDLSRALRNGEPVLAREFHDSLVRSADIVAARARVNASFSANIPGTIRPFATATRVGVRANAGRKPHSGEGAAFENKGVGGSFRHPVFGHRETFVSQAAHPFLTPAAEESLPQVEAEVVKAIDVFSSLLERG